MFGSKKAKQPKFARDPRGTLLKQLWSADRVTLSLGAYDRTRKFGGDARAIDPTWLGYLHSESRGPLLPTTLTLVRADSATRDGPEPGYLGEGFLEAHDGEGHLQYKVSLFDPDGHISDALYECFLQAAASRFRWIQIVLHKVPQREEEWLRPWQEHSCSDSHRIKFVYLNARAKLPDAPRELFAWLEEGDLPTR